MGEGGLINPPQLKNSSYKLTGVFRGCNGGVGPLWTILSLLHLISLTKKKQQPIHNMGFSVSALVYSLVTLISIINTNAD